MIIFFIQGIIVLTLLVLLIYFIAKRLDDKKREDFEKRDN